MVIYNIYNLIIIIITWIITYVRCIVFKMLKLRHLTMLLLITCLFKKMLKSYFIHFVSVSQGWKEYSK
jgi:hypothetical protein